MKHRILIYCVAFVAGFLIWAGLSIIEAINPMLPWKYAPVALLTGVTMPGGATPELYYLNHMVETWFPFFIAFITARTLSRKRAKFSGALVVYAAFLVWSLGMLWLDRLGVPINTIFYVGLVGTFIGGAILYLLFIDPVPVNDNDTKLHAVSQ
jgi:hypothetical protein